MKKALKYIIPSAAVGMIVLGVSFYTGYTVAANAVESAPRVEYITLSAGQKEPEKMVVTVDYINKKLENISELMTAELSYTGIYSVVEGDIPLLTQKGFSMIYSGEVKAGINMSKTKVEITDNEVTISIPDSEVLLINVDPATIEFYDQKKALFNWTDLDDSIHAVVCAENDIKDKADIDELLEKANYQAEEIIRALLEDVVRSAEGEKDLVIKHCPVEAVEA